MEPDLIIELVKNDILFWKFSANDIASLASFFGVIVSFATVCITVTKYGKDRKKALNIEAYRQLEQLRKETDNKIESFFGPINELREESKILYNIFAIDLKEQARKSNNYFRTIEFLCFNTNELSVTDGALLQEIRTLSNKTLNLIEQKIGMVTNPALASLLGKACAHFRILELACQKKLVGQWEKLKDMDIAFPLELDGALTNEVRKLEENYNQKKLEIFNNAEILQKINSTIKYYDDNTHNYYVETMFVDMSEIYKKFRSHLKTGASILDIGCGVGRDTKYFIQHGYKVYSIDASHGMVEICRKYPFAFCKQMNMQDIDFYEEFDAVWANASLLHLTTTEFKEVIKKLINTVKQEGIIFFSLKEKDNRPELDKRYYKFYKPDEVKNLMSQFNNLEHIHSWTDDKCFNNFIFRKKVINKER